MSSVKKYKHYLKLAIQGKKTWEEFSEKHVADNIKVLHALYVKRANRTHDEQWLSLMETITGHMTLRLAARIYDLKKIGFHIDSRIKRGHKYGEYRLENVLTLD